MLLYRFNLIQLTSRIEGRWGKRDTENQHNKLERNLLSGKANVREWTLMWNPQQIALQFCDPPLCNSLLVKSRWSEIVREQAHFPVDCDRTLKTFCGCSQTLNFTYGKQTVRNGFQGGETSL
ncbi:hypothetical protein CDAR_227921 [Caerostris darwini]|uniref:Uncharacterized protein n=1 Tax=Caerostris darwini TaxID=1538125 RepID=A0AAV4VD91_9ARAC|nr:hypothetical protein CDAR_227921 [Caerostris darwini]